MDRCGVFTDGNVLGNVSEARAGSGDAFFETGLAGKLVLHDVEIQHEESVLARGFEERVVPLQFRKMVRRALAVEQLKQFALGVVALQGLRLRARGCGNEKYKCCNEARNELFRRA